MQDLVFEPHPSIALSLFQVGQAYAKENDPDKAREFLRRSLDMRTRLLPEGSPSIRETEALLAKLPAEVKLEVITEKQTEP